MSRQCRQIRDRTCVGQIGRSPETGLVKSTDFMRRKLTSRRRRENSEPSRHEDRKDSSGKEKDSERIKEMS